MGLADRVPAAPQRSEEVVSCAKHAKADALYERAANLYDQHGRLIDEARVLEEEADLEEEAKAEKEGGGTSPQGGTG